MKSYKFIFTKLDPAGRKVLARNIYITSGDTFAAAKEKLNTGFGDNVLVKMQQAGFQRLEIKEI